MEVHSSFIEIVEFIQTFLSCAYPVLLKLLETGASVASCPRFEFNTLICAKGHGSAQTSHVTICKQDVTGQYRKAHWADVLGQKQLSLRVA